ncbi:heat-inducible transcriptional repressor HrcA [Alkalibacterium thalassium]|uniref:Heat-inducible transcription repressor HrcA n=1 Tax=Alkalibacterium thalassium TaxID=426701 RepID=A0A1G8VUN3_9LACT|nr:heat-inducible transcriptional repressor HrcA [Alkalibacterium thalassium]SDJ69533.1 heat-inducible transcription repressor HrcA [Alkalibacterium thalassium]
MLTKRQINILDALIRLYTSTGHPIGSKTIMTETAIDASSATIRNELSFLEKLGFIQKTHSSSGRVPSMKGYRYYIDHLVKPQEVAEDKLQIINEVLGNHVKQMDDIMNQSAKLLSDLTSYTAIVLGPKAESSRLTGFRLVALNDNLIMAIVQTDGGLIENKVFRLPKPIDESDMVKVANIFNQHLVGLPLMEVARKLEQDIPFLIRKYASNAMDMYLSLESAFNASAEDRYHVSGKMNLLDFTEDMDKQQLKSLYSLLDNKGNLNVLIDPIHEDFVVKIGDEFDNELFTNFSLVTAAYQVSGHGRGILAVLGPTSMSYDETFGVLDVFRKQLTHTLLNYYLE